MFNTPVNPGKIHILLGQSALQTFAKKYLAGPHERKFPLLNIVESFFTKGHYVTGMVPAKYVKSKREQEPNQPEEQVHMLQDCCVNTMSLNLTNQIVDESACEKHRFNSLCHDCVVLNSSKKITTTLEEVYRKITVKEENGKKKLEAKMSWLEDPGIHFTSEKSNREEAFTQAKKRVRALLKKDPTAQAKLHELQQKYIESKAYRQLNNQEVEDLLKGGHHYLKHSYTVNNKSASTKIREIVDPASLDDNANTSINALLEDLPLEYTAIPVVLQAFRLYKHAASLDIKAMFHTIDVHPDDRPFQLLASFDFSKTDWENHPLDLMVEALPFGNKNSPGLADAGVRIAAKDLAEPMRTLLNDARIVDNITFSRRNRQDMKNIANKLDSQLKEYSMILKPGDYSGEESQEDTLYLLGYKYEPVQDKISAISAPNLSKKIKGQHSRPDLTTDNLENQPPITTRMVCRFVNSFFDPLGLHCQYWNMELKHLFAKVCKVFGPTELDIPLSTRMPKLEEEFKRICSKILANPPKPHKREILGDNEYMTHVFLAVDGSDIGMAATVHARIEDCKTGLVRTKLIRAANKHEDKLSVPSHEIHAFRLGVKILGETLLALKTFMEGNEFEKLEVVIASDSLSTCLQLLNGASSKTHTRLAKNIGLEIQQLVTAAKQGGLSKPFRFVWLKSQLNPSDLNSKIQQDYRHPPTLWSEGPPCYKHTSQLEEITWATHDGRFTQNSNFLPWIWPTDKECVNMIVEAEDTDQSFSQTLKGSNDSLWNPALYDAPEWSLSPELYKTLQQQAETFSDLVSCLCRILQFANAVNKAKRAPRRLTKEETIHQALTLIYQASQKAETPKVGKMVTVEEVQGVLCSTLKLGETHEDLNMTLLTPIVKEESLAMLIMKAAHTIYIPTMHRHIHRNKTSTIAATRMQPLSVYILQSDKIANRVIKTCSFCNKANKQAYRRENIKFSQFYKTGGASYFGAVSLDLVGPIEIKGARSNSTKKVWILVLLCLRTGMVEFYPLEKITTRAVFVALLTHQNRHGPLFEIITDFGSQLRKLDLSYHDELAGEDLQVLTLLQ